MSIEHWCNDAAKSLAKMACALSLAFSMACGGGREIPCGDRVCDPAETADSCPEDCGCGNRIVNPGEQCDGPDLGGGTCMDAVNRGGTLRCNADCTFDVSGCTLASCGNGVVEQGEACDGADLGAGTCASIGYAGGDVGCTMDCAYDVSACCSDTCPAAGVASCIGDTLRECVASSSGCLAWQTTDCAASNNVCASSGATATCTCVDRCMAVGDSRCEGAAVETCADVGGCLDWTSTTNCATAGDICAEAPSGPVCTLDVSAEDCADPYPLSPGDNVVAWTALDADYVSSQPSCNTTTLDGPDLVLSYTAPEDGFVSFTLHKPASARQVVVVSSAACGTVTPELDCLSDFTPTTLQSDLPVEMGTTYYFYVRDTTSGSAPLDNPLLVTLDEALCSSLAPTATAMFPANGARVPDQTPLFAANFDYPIDPTQGVVTLTGDMGTNLSYNLANGPAEIAIVNGGKTLQIDPGVVIPIGETMTVTWTGLLDATCAHPIAAPSWSVTVTGPPYSITAGTTVYADACVGGTQQALASGTSDDGLTAPISLPAGFQFFGQPATQVIASTNGWLSVDTSLTNSYLSDVAMPNSAQPNGLIAPYWNDLTSTTICTQIVGNTLVVQWTGVVYPSTSGIAVQFQAIFDPSGSIELVYGPNQQGNGTSATIGVEDQTGTYAVQLSSNAAGSVTPSSSKLLTPN